MKYEYPDITTSDVCLKAYGRTLSEMFANAGLALVNATVEINRIGEKVEREIEVKGNDLKSLMFNWLNEIIFHIDSENLAFSRIEAEVDGKAFSLKAKAWGEEIDPERHRTKTHVKAATYHMMEIKREGSLWTGQVILDI